MPCLSFGLTWVWSDFFNFTKKKKIIKLILKNSLEIFSLVFTKFSTWLRFGLEVWLTSCLSLILAHCLHCMCRHSKLLGLRFSLWGYITVASPLVNSMGVLVWQSNLPFPRPVCIRWSFLAQLGIFSALINFSFWHWKSKLLPSPAKWRAGNCDHLCLCVRVCVR
jgi:hypothetical protein